MPRRRSEPTSVIQHPDASQNALARPFSPPPLLLTPPSSSSSSGNNNNPKKPTVSRLTLRLFGGGSPEKRVDQALTFAVDELKAANMFVTRAGDANSRGARRLAAWAAREQNSALADVAAHTAELLTLYAHTQRRFAEDYEHCVAQLQKLVSTGAHTDELRALEPRVDALLEKERRLRKELQRRVSNGGGGGASGILTQSSKSSSRRRASDGDAYALQRQLEETERERRAAQRDRDAARAESEVARMYHARAGLRGVADAHCRLAAESHAIWDVARELAELVPAIAGRQDPRELRYEGAPTSSRRVRDLRRSLQLGVRLGPALQPLDEQDARLLATTPRRSAPTAGNSRSRRVQEPRRTPPPPYTETAEEDETATTMRVEGGRRSTATSRPPPQNNHRRQQPRSSGNNATTGNRVVRVVAAPDQAFLLSPRLSAGHILQPIESADTSLVSARNRAAAAMPSSRDSPPPKNASAPVRTTPSPSPPTSAVLQQEEDVQGTPTTTARTRIYPRLS